jgi:hypothetical protein
MADSRKIMHISVLPLDTLDNEAAWAITLMALMSDGEWKRVPMVFSQKDILANTPDKLARLFHALLSCGFDTLMKY